MRLPDSLSWQFGCLAGGFYCSVTGQRPRLVFALPRLSAAGFPSVRRFCGLRRVARRRPQAPRGWWTRAAATSRRRRPPWPSWPPEHRLSGPRPFPLSMDSQCYSNHFGAAPGCSGSLMAPHCALCVVVSTGVAHDVHGQRQRRHCWLAPWSAIAPEHRLSRRRHFRLSCDSLCESYHCGVVTGCIGSLMVPQCASLVVVGARIGPWCPRPASVSTRLPLPGPATPPEHRLTRRVHFPPSSDSL